MGTRQMPDKFVLFDIDGTLLHCGSSARESLAQAVSEVSGHSIELQIEDVAGSTDLGIMRHALQRAGFTDGELEQQVAQAGSTYLEIVKTAYPARNDQYLYPGVETLLARLAARPDVRLGLLTGNLYEGARVKLDPFDIWDYFAMGAFGSDSADRNDLPGIALSKAATQLGEHFTPAHTLLVGDTPRDALCARVNDIRALIVCRRPEWLEDILPHHPFRVVNSTEDTENLFNLITNFPYEK